MEIILTTINNFLYDYILVFLLIGAGIFFTFKTKFIQLRLFKVGFKELKQNQNNSKAFSSWQALMAATGGRVGSGNILGVAMALSIGGAGSLFWMWISAILGACTACIEAILAQLYKIKVKDGFRGGPAYYILKGLHNKFFSFLFCFLLIITAFIYMAFQVHNITESINIYVNNYSLTIILVGFVIISCMLFYMNKNSKFIGQLNSYLVPLMAFLFIFLAIIVISINIEKMPIILSNIFTSAFNIEAISGGLLGSCILQGIKRGLFSNEAGMGNAPNIAAMADVSHPVKQGLAQSISVYIDTLIISTISGLMFLSIGIDNNTYSILNIYTLLNEILPNFGGFMIILCLTLFSFTSIFSNYLYSINNIKFLQEHFPNRQNIINYVFKVLVIIALLFGLLTTTNIIWNLADISMALMTIINVFSLLCLFKKAKYLINDFEIQLKDNEDPIFINHNYFKNAYCWD